MSFEVIIFLHSVTIASSSAKGEDCRIVLVYTTTTLIGFAVFHFARFVVCY